jgi:16S rRNA (cytidine1402-2'-O)-methyltransferase
MRGQHGEEAQERGRGRGRLYVVATPIGNLADMSRRALDVLRAVDVIFAEDTRVTRALLAHYGIDARPKALHANNEERATRDVLDALEAGRDVAIVSDAGTPGISDPGARAVRLARDAGAAVVPIPGASALSAALSVSGMQGPFAFLGFLPARRAARRKVLEGWRDFPHVLVLYEAPHRILECAADLIDELGGARDVVSARELTKLFESVHACRLADAPAWLAADAHRQRGEFVLIVSGAPATRDDETESRRVLAALLAELPVKTAVKVAAQITGAPRNALYAAALELRRTREH